MQDCFWQNYNALRLNGYAEGGRKQAPAAAGLIIELSEIVCTGLLCPAPCQKDIKRQKLDGLLWVSVSEATDSSAGVVAVAG